MPTAPEGALLSTGAESCIESGIISLESSRTHQTQQPGFWLRSWGQLVTCYECLKNTSEDHLQIQTDIQCLGWSRGLGALLRLGPHYERHRQPGAVRIGHLVMLGWGAGWGSVLPELGMVWEGLLTWVQVWEGHV